jgi:ABC-type bacteriocin/lantibiotic exporter with double-glycine peptidase domain
MSKAKHVLRSLITQIIKEELDDEKLNVKPFDQTKGLCGPASLKMVLRYFGEEYTEDELKNLSGATKSDGVGAEYLVATARELGYDAWIEDNASIDDLAKYVHDGTPVIVDWFSTDDGHYSVVVEIDKEKQEIKLQDPEIRQLRTMPIETFKNVWFDFDSKRPETDSFVVRRLIVIRPSS